MEGTERAAPLSTFAKDWWLPSHEYVQRQLARGRSLSPHYLDNARAQLRRYILPAFGGCRLSAITTAQIDDWLFHLHKECHLNADTANHCLGRLRQMLGYASFQGYIAGNPAREVEPLAIKAKVRGILTPAEVGELFATPWKDKRVCAAAITGCSCGLRLGEIQGLQWQHLHLEEPQPWLSVQHSWGRKYGLLPTPKCGSVRDIPLPSRTADALRAIMRLTKYKQPDDLVFASPHLARHRHGTKGQPGKTPIGQGQIDSTFYAALHSRLGISEQKRKERNLVFHSLRHTFISYCRGNVPDHILRRLSGHRSDAIENYTHIGLSDLASVVAVQSKIVG